MRYLVHSGNSTYNAPTKKFNFNLDRRFPNPTKVKLSKVNYIASTKDAYPTVVYLRSSAIDDLIKTKHTVELNDIAHENPSDALVILEETHEIARYRGDGSITFPIHGHKASTVIDFYFTDNTTNLDGIYTPVEVSGTTDDDMESHVFNSDIRVWLDFAKPDLVLNAALEQAAVGESINRIISRVPGGDLQLMTSGIDKVQYTTFGDHMFGCKQQIGAAWSYSIDGSGGGFDFESGSHIFLLRSPPDATALEVIWQSSTLHLFYWSDTLQYKTGSPEVYQSTGLVVLDDTPYLLEVKYTPSGSDWYLRNLNTEVTATALNQPVLRGHDATQVKMISTAQSHQLGTFGDYLHTTPGNAANDGLAYLLQKYKGEATVPVIDPNGKDASFFLQLDIDMK